MKYFFATRHTEGLQANLFGRSRYAVCLQEVYLISNSGLCFYESNIKSSNLIAVGDRVLQYIRETRDDQGVELIGHGSPIKFIALASMFGGTFSPYYPKEMPQFFTDLSQTIIEYMELLDDEDFGLDSDFTFVAEKKGDSYTLEQKVAMFMSHRDCPQPIINETLADESFWLSRVNAYVTQHRLATTYRLKLPLLKDEDDNYQ